MQINSKKPIQAHKKKQKSTAETKASKSNYDNNKQYNKKQSNATIEQYKHTYNQ